MKVAVIVLNWNSKNYISVCLDSLLKLSKTGHQIEIVVIDNGSTDDSLGFLQSKYPRLTYLVNPSNLGYAQGNNTGLRYAIQNSFDFAWVVNPDVHVAPDALTALLAAASPKMGILGSKAYFSPGFEFHPQRYTKANLGHVLWYAGGKFDWANIQSIHLGVDEVDHGQFDQIQATEFVTGASMLLNVAMLKSIGVFDPNYYLYFEEADLCVRASRTGWQLLYVPKSIVWHANAQAAGIGSHLQDYFLTRNRLLFGFKYAPWRSRFALFRQSLNLFLTGRPWQKTGIRDYYLGRLGRGSYA